MNTTYTEVRDTMQKHVLFIDGARTVRAFDAVVVQVDQFTKNRPHRTIVLQMNTLDKNLDKSRVQRLCRRLRKIGLGLNTAALNGACGTIFAHSKSAF